MILRFNEFANVIEFALRDNKVEVRSSSMSNRTRGGIERAMIFGDESTASTGATSIKTAKKSLSATALAEKAAVSILDEPDIGLSPYYSRALGKHIAEEFNAMTDKKGLILISHSKELINNFLAYVEKDVVTIGVNTNKSLSDWFNNTDIASIDELLDLDSYGREKEIAILRQLK